MSAEFQRQVTTAIHFGFDRDDLDAEARRIVAAQAKWILGHPEVRFAVTGHTDRVGSNGYNMDLGLRRANRVVAALVAHGVDPNRLIARVSQGEEVNLVDTENRERLNRRTVTEVIGIRRTATGPDGLSMGLDSYGATTGESIPPSIAVAISTNAPTEELGGADANGGGGTGEGGSGGGGTGQGGSGGGGTSGGGAGGGGTGSGGSGSGGTGTGGAGTGNPGNDMDVGQVGETPNENAEWGAGNQGQAN